MSTTLPYNVSDNTLTFFARSRPYEVQRGHAHFDVIKGILTYWRQEPRAESDIDSLIALADPKEEIMRAAGGHLEFIGSELSYGGVALHNLWVDKILAFRDAGEPYDPIFAALQDLQLNPTPEARDRLPIFVERSKLGFLPDGRIAAFKGVRENFNDVHSNTVNYAVGKTVAIPRAACNADPNQTCVAGLHVGAIDYIQQMGYGWGSDRRMLLCAFWPRHAVAVPTDYRGGKMRVEQLEVLDEVDRDFVDRLLNDGTLIVRGYGDSSSPFVPASSTVAAAPAAKTGALYEAKVGDWIEIEDDSDLSGGVYLVASIDDDEGADYRINAQVTKSYTEAVENDAVKRILSEPPMWMKVKKGDWITVGHLSGPRLVVDIDESILTQDDARIEVSNGTAYDEEWVNGEDVEQILSEPPAIWLRVQSDDKVRIEGHSFLKDGVYDVNDIDAYGEDGEDGKRVEIATADDDYFYVKNRVIKAIVREEEEAAKAAPAPAADTTSGDSSLQAAAVTDTRPVWEQVLEGDVVRIEGDGDTDDGSYTVLETDDALNRGPLSVGLRVKDDGGYGSWIYNKSVVEIVERDGKPFGVQPAAPAVETRPVWEQVEKGDTVRVEGSSYFSNGTYVVKRLPEPGELTSTERYGFRLEGTNTLWVEKAAIKEIISKATPVDTRPAWEQAKAGDTIRVNDIPRGFSGEYVVDSIDPDNGMNRRLRVTGAPRYWMDNSAVVAVVKKA